MNDNPYASPAELFEAGHHPIDSAAREELCRVIDDFLSDRIGAFGFDEALWEIRDQTADPTVQIVAEQLWYTYDDLKDHMAVLDKHNWNAIQRLLLVLKSNAQLHWDKRKLWHTSQAVAFGTLATTLWACTMFGQAWALHLSLAGLVSIALRCWRGRKLRTWEQVDPWNMWPFPSFAAIRVALNRAPSFRKQRYRPELARRHIRSRASVFTMQLPWRIGYCIASPIVLIAQCFPLRIERLELTTAIDA